VNHAGIRSLLFAVIAILTLTAQASAQERLCDNSFEDCRATILQMIRDEKVGIDVSFWFMDDARYSAEIIRRWQAGVRVRVIADLRADKNYPVNSTVRQSLINAGIPIRHKTTAGVNHWKMMLYAGQGKVHFSGGNFSDGSYSPIVPYTRYVDEAIYFTNDPAVVQTFMTKYDDLWLDAVNYQNLANVTALTRNYPIYPLSPDLNFPPNESYQDRLVAALKLETTAVDAVMFRITSGKIPDELIRRQQAGVAVRLITDRNQYRNPTYFWDSYNVDRMYAAGIQVKWKDNQYGQDVHQKSVVLKGRDMAVFGSSNWTSSSSDSQREHNYFTTKPWFVDWFIAQFERKWNNVQDPSTGGGPIVPAMFLDFAPLPPDEPINLSPANMSIGQTSTVTLKWEGGWWSHKYDIYLGTTPNPPLVMQNFAPGSATAGINSAKESLVMSNLAPSTTYYWRIVGKTMAGKATTGPVWSFTTGGAPITMLSANDIVLYAADATTIMGRWSLISDSTAAGGRRMDNPDAGAATITTPLASPADYFELTFNAQVGRAYRLWLRGRANNNSGYSDSIYAQFSGSIDGQGAPIYRIGTSSGAWVNLEDCGGCANNGWGWQDNGFGAGVLGPLISFATGGPQTIRIQVREDGFSIDQIVLSPDTFVTMAPGTQKLDALILPKQGGI
jgi:phosphatidylserine/phosphatidylglycerophosphate/cardiolipin synthase-like enzyme